MSPEPRDIVAEFFERMADDERRQTVGELFTEETVITVPTAQFEGPDAATELLAFLEPRYERAQKEFDRWITTDDHVISLGTLYGTDNDGEAFDDVRYADIYRIKDGKIARLDIYNDLAAEGVVES